MVSDLKDDMSKRRDSKKRPPRKQAAPCDGEPAPAGGEGSVAEPLRCDLVEGSDNCRHSHVDSQVPALA